MSRSNKYSNDKIVWFPEKLASFRDNKITAPIYVRVKPTNRCPHSCNFCAYGHGEWSSGMHEGMDARAVIPRAKMLETLWDFQEMGVKALTFSGGGEPLTHPDITEFMLLTLNYKIALSIITNGNQLENRRAEILAQAHWVRVSVDYTTAEQMAETRKIMPDNFGRILGNIAAFAKIKDDSCDLGVNYITTRDNYRGLAEFAKRLKGCGVDNLRVSPVWRPDFQEYHAPIADAVRAEIEAAQKLADNNFSVYSSYDLESSSHSIERGYHKCYFTQMVPVVGADQMVYHCHNTAFSDHGVIGSIKEQSFKQLWFSDEAKAAFERLDPSRQCLHQCAADSKNHNIAGFLEAYGDSFV